MQTSTRPTTQFFAEKNSGSFKLKQNPGLKQRNLGC